MEPRGTTHSEESLLQDIREAMDTQATRRQEATHRRLSEALEQVRRVHEDVRKSLPIVLNSMQSGYSVVGDFGRNRRCAKLSWKLKRLRTLWFDDVG